MADCDIVLLVWNQPEVTRRCIESLFACTRRAVRLLIVDNGSDAPTRDYLATVASQGSIEVVHLRNETNEGFARGMNRGLRESTAPWVCLLNNDTVVTDGWLDRMLEVGATYPEVGLINPVSNTFGDGPPPGISLAAHAAAVAVRPAGYVEVGACVGFCWLIRRAVIERIGLLDEAMGLVFFEDTDYSRRALQAGFRSVVARRAYVHHEEHRTVRTLPQRERLFQENRRRFEAKWGRPLRIAYAVPAGDPQILAPDIRWAVTLARRGALVQLFLPSARATEPPSYFAAAGLAPHADVQLLGTPRGWRQVPWLLWRAIARRLTLRPPKLFDLLIAPDAQTAQTLRRWRRLHRAEIVLRGNEEELNRQWQIRSRSPSS